ncbi:MAG: Aldehyde dehydrogenase [Candidatus Methanolliviera sp. GoM_oil]|nr:MAG: Aldehyde dehydrogenase [Candidatus Methanolliviera sp. GoM_oil]
MVKYKEKLEEQKVFIDGEWTMSSKGDTYSIINPSTGKTFVECQKCDVGDAKRAIDAARDAFDNGPWPEMSFEARTKIFYKVSDMIAEKAWEISKLDASCNGVPAMQHATTVMDMAPHFKYVCERAKELAEPKGVTGEFPMDQTVWREQDGVIAIITPWNVPFWQMALKLPSALISGNTVVFKPASQTPISVLAVAGMFEEAGLPKGALNVITGPGSVVGAEMAKSDKVDHIAFTGETATGKGIVQNAAGNLKKVTLELGGKSPNIIFGDIPVDEAAKLAVLGVALGNGEECFAGTRVLVEETIYEAVCKKTAEIYGSLDVGNALSLKTKIGPLVTEEQMKKVLGYIESGKEEGATLLCGGGRLQEGELKDGFFVAPTVFSNVSNDMKIAREEIFGPVISMIPFSTEKEAIEIANDSIYGLAGGVMTNDRAKAIRVARKMKTGNVFVNTWHVTSWYMPFGGYKQSGWGRLAGESGIEEFTQVKSIYADWGGFTKWLLKTLLLH